MPPSLPPVQLPPPVPGAQGKPDGSEPADEPVRPSGKKLGSVNGWTLYRGTDEYFFVELTKDKSAKPVARQ